MTRLRLKLQGLECDIRYKQEKENVVADFLSRLPKKQSEHEHRVMVTTRAQARMENTSNTEPNRTELSNIDSTQVKKMGNNYVNESLYEEFTHSISLNEIPSEILGFSNSISMDAFDANLIIINSRSAYAELAQFCDLPHGLKDYTVDDIIFIPEKRIVGLKIQGKQNSLLESKDFFFKYIRAFEKLTLETPEANNIQVVSFRKIKHYEIIQMIQFAAWKARKQCTLYNADCERMAVKSEEIETILREFHDAPLGGHVGAKRMLNRIKTLYTWSNMRRDVENYVKQCDSCQRNEIHKKNKIAMKITTTAAEPLEKLYMDIVVLPESNWGNKYGLVIQDDLTRCLIVAPMENQESETVARTFVEHVICKFGTPLELVTDNGTNFVSSLMKNICKI